MAPRNTPSARYAAQRPPRTPPHVSLGDLRAAVGLTLDQVCARLEEHSGHRYTRGALSAIENGHRGASVETIEALTVAYGLRPGAITTAYEPRVREALAS